MRRSLVISLATLLAATAVPVAQAVQSPVELPVFHPAVERGGYAIEELPRSRPTGKTIDGAIDDWVGESPRLGGTVVTSRGELIYSDHLFDSYGAATPEAAEQQRQVDSLAEAAPDLYRVDPLRQAPSQLDGNLPATEENIGTGPRVDEADLLELRLSANRGELRLLARTTTMTNPDAAGVLLLVDDGSDSGSHEVGFGSGLTTDKAEYAALVRNGSVSVVDLRAPVAVPVAAGSAVANAEGYTNAIEAAIPLSAIGARGGSVSVAAGVGLLSGDGLQAISNVAFRTAEPVSTWFEKEQALVLSDGTIDPFFSPVDVAALAAGANERLVPLPGYHDRIFVSSEAISRESGQDGIHQHYGLYLPHVYDDADRSEVVPLTFWLHWRGGKAHSAGTLSPRIMRDNGEGRGGIVVSPRGRGTSEWYLGKGHVDFNEVWDDVFASFAADENRVYVTGHSMGGWGSYLLSILYPDRFAASFPVAGPVTQGAWTGADFEGCDDMKYDEYSPCYIETNSSDPRAQHTRPLLENLRNVPIAIFQGGIDELVPTSGVTRQVERLTQLGYRHRYYLFPTYEHYSHPVVDEWMEGVRYTNQFVRDPNPAHVSYIRSMPFERTVESGPNQQNIDQAPYPFDFSFDSAYWMSGLTPVDPVNGIAHFEGRSRAIAEAPAVLAPEAGGPAAPGQAGPYTMNGLSWLADPLAAAPVTANGFEVTLSGASEVTLDGYRMGLDPTQPIDATIVSDVAGAVVKVVFGDDVREFVATGQ